VVPLKSPVVAAFKQFRGPASRLVRRKTWLGVPTIRFWVLPPSPPT